MRASTPELNVFIHLLNALALLHSNFLIESPHTENMMAFIMSESVSVLKSRVSS